MALSADEKVVHAGVQVHTVLHIGCTMCHICTRPYLGLPLVAGLLHLRRIPLAPAL